MAQNEHYKSYQRLCVACSISQSSIAPLMQTLDISAWISYIVDFTYLSFAFDSFLNATRHQLRQIAMEDVTKGLPGRGIQPEAVLPQLKHTNPAYKS